MWLCVRPLGLIFVWIAIQQHVSFISVCGEWNRLWKSESQHFALMMLVVKIHMVRFAVNRLAYFLSVIHHTRRAFMVYRGYCFTLSRGSFFSLHIRFTRVSLKGFVWIYFCSTVIFIKYKMISICRCAILTSKYFDEVWLIIINILTLQ